MKTKYRSLTKKEEETVLIKIIETLLDKSVPFSGKHRHKQWEKGWGENYKSGDVTPRYFGKYLVNRLNGRFIMALDKDYEQNKLYEIVDKYANKYLSKAPVVCEFGCGTGHNLLRVAKINSDADLVGLDWATSSQKILNGLGDRFFGYNFDFFNPNKSFYDKFYPGTAVYTVAALEQTGEKYKKFVKYLIDNNPSVVVHIEPIPELLDPANLLDYLSIKYMEKRKYLKNYLKYLRHLESKGAIEILEAKRSGVGSMYIDGYSIIVWRPK